jgi:hypothetical protein
MSRLTHKKKFNKAICKAIGTKAILQFEYHGTLRTIEPQSHGISSAGNEVVSPDFSRCGKSEGQQVQIDENRNELEHCAPWRSNSLGKLKSDHGEMAPLIW